MKENILMLDEDIEYSKKFCNQGNKLYGDKYLFLCFSNVKSVKEYIADNNKSNLIISKRLLNDIDDELKGITIVLDEENKEYSKEGRKVHIYKLQNVKKILKLVDEVIDSVDEKLKIYDKGKTKLITFFAIDYIKNKFELVKRIAKYISKKYKVLIVDLDEFENYKGKTGMSNIIFNYKEDRLDAENIEKEVMLEKNQSIIKSVTYPEDMNVISNIDLAKIIEKMMELSYDYIFVNLDMSYVKSEYLLNDSDVVVLMRDTLCEKLDKIKTHLRNENAIDIEKIYEMNINKIDRTYLIEFAKSIIGDRNG